MSSIVKILNPNLAKITWTKEDPNMSSVFGRKNFMKITTSSFFVYYI